MPSQHYFIDLPARAAIIDPVEMAYEVFIPALQVYLEELSEADNERMMDLLFGLTREVYVRIQYRYPAYPQLMPIDDVIDVTRITVIADGRMIELDLPTGYHDKVADALYENDLIEVA